MYCSDSVHACSGAVLEMNFTQTSASKLVWGQIQISLGSKITVPQSMARSKFPWETRSQCLNPWPDPGFLGKQDHSASIHDQIQVSSNKRSLGHWWPAGQIKTLSNVLRQHMKWTLWADLACLRRLFLRKKEIASAAWIFWQRKGSNLPYPTSTEGTNSLQSLFS